MATLKSFEEMDAWVLSRKLIRTVRNICKREVAKRDYAFVDQITRSSRSISANIAEGFESMTTPEFILFLSYAKRSAGEVRAHLYDALEEKYISDEEFLQLKNVTEELCKQLAGFIHYLQSTDQKRRRTLSTLTINN